MFAFFLSEAMKWYREAEQTTDPELREEFLARARDYERQAQKERDVPRTGRVALRERTPQGCDKH